MASVKKSESGGATLAIGGGNKADYTQKTSIIGVNNIVTGTSGSVSRYNMVNGYKNTASNVQHVSVIGSGNTVKDTDTALLLGDNRTLSGATNSLVIGSADNVTTTDQQNVGGPGTQCQCHSGRRCGPGQRVPGCGGSWICWV